MAGVGIEHDNYLGCLLVHAVVFAKGVHHPFPEGFGIAGVYAVTKEDDGFEIVKGDVDVLTFFILHLALHRNVVFTKHAGLEDGTEVVAYRLEIYVEKTGDFVLEHPHGSVYYFDFDNGFADFFFCDLYVSSFHNDFVGGEISYLWFRQDLYRVSYRNAVINQGLTIAIGRFPLLWSFCSNTAMS